MKASVRAHVIVTGRVQGVFYRLETCEAAERIGGLGGWVRNRKDGSVEAVIEGPAEKVAQLIDWCRQGPPRARVGDVAVDWQPATGEFSRFTVAY